jgi:DNA primase
VLFPSFVFRLTFKAGFEPKRALRDHTTHRPPLQDLEFKEFVNRVKLSASIEEVVRTRVTSLKRAGRLFQACCPFHEESTPSFKVDPDRGSWRCYGACGEGGDVIEFLQRSDNATFLEALKTAASFAGIPLPDDGFGKRKREDSDRFKPLYDIMERAEKLYRRKLQAPEAEGARRYLTERGLGPELCDVFGVGWAPSHGSPVLDSATKAGLDADKLEQVGLVRQREGRAYDFFYNRIVIPIRDDKGRTVGFGARCLPDDGDRGPKYVNTPETPLFHKGRLIYGYDLALATIRREKRLVLVEGYTDVMAAHGAGYRMVCAVLGTSTTSDHAALVRRSGARRVTLVFDGDEAGAKATQRALIGLLPLGIEIDVAPPPDGQDPCDLCQAEGGRAFQQLLDQPMAWLDFLLQRIQGLTGRELSDAVDDLFLVVREVKTPVHRASLLTSIAEGLGLPAVDVRTQYEDLVKRRPLSSREPHGRSVRPSLAQGASGAHEEVFIPSNWDGMAESGAELDSYEPPFHVPAGTGYAPESKARGNGGPRQTQRDRLRSAQERNEVISWRQLVGALLADNGLIPRYLDPSGDDFFLNCPEPSLNEIVSTLRSLYFNGPDDLELDAQRVAESLPDTLDPLLPARLEALAENGVAADLAADSLKFIQTQEHLRTVQHVREQLAQATTPAEQEVLLGQLAEALRVQAATT